MKKKILTLFAIGLLALPAGVLGQVVIEPASSSADPLDFAVLQLESGGSKGLRLPQLTNAQRDALTAKINALTTDEEKLKAIGLIIMNISQTPATIQVYNGTTWIEINLPTVTN